MRAKDLLILLGLALLRISSVLLLYCFVELGGNENHSVVLDSFGILPFLWLEIALYSEECSLCLLYTSPSPRDS